MNTTSQSDYVLGFKSSSEYYNMSYKNIWTLVGTADTLSIGCDKTTISTNDKIVKLNDIYNNTTILSTVNLPPDYTKFTSLATGNNNYIWALLYTTNNNSNNIYNYVNGYWDNITNNGLFCTLSSIYLGFDGSVWGISKSNSNNVYNYIFNNTLTNGIVLPVWKQVVTIYQFPINLVSMAVMTINYFLGISYDETIKIYTINLYLNYGYGFLTSPILIPNPIIGTEIISINISCCYTGNIYCVCNNLLFKRTGMSASNLAGSSWVQVSVDSSREISQITTGPSYAYSSILYFPYFNNIFGFSENGQNGPSYYMLKDLQNWSFVGLATTLSNGDIYNNVIVIKNFDIFYITNVNFSIPMSSIGLPTGFIFNSLSNIIDKNTVITWGIVNSNSIYTYKYITETNLNISYGTWYPILPPTSNTLIDLSLGFDGSVWLLDNEYTIYNYDSKTAIWITIGPSPGYKSLNISAINYTNLWGTLTTNLISFFTYSGEVNISGQAKNPTEFVQTLIPGPISNLFIYYSYDSTIWCICNGLLFKNINDNIWEQYTPVGNNPLITQIEVDSVGIYGYSPSKYFTYNSITKLWELSGNADCISTNQDLNIIVCYGTIIILYNELGKTIYLNTIGLPTNFKKFVKISATKNICGIISDDLTIVYQYIFTDNIQNGTWVSIGGPIITIPEFSTSKLTDLSTGIDGSIYVINTIISNTNVLSYTTYNYSNSVWSQVNIIASQISVYNSDNIIGVYNNIITKYINITTINISLPEFKNYVQYSYDNTIWCMSAGLIFELKNLYTLTPYWLLRNEKINDYHLTTISVTPSYSFSNNSYYTIPFLPVIAAYSSIAKTGAILFNQNWIIYGLGDGLSYGSDQNVIIYNGSSVYIVNNLGIIFNLNTENLPSNFEFISIDMGNINNIWGIIKDDTTYVYTYNFTTNIQDGIWSIITQPEIPLNSISVGYDGSIFGIDITNHICYYTKSTQIWTQTQYQSTNISVASDNYLWGSLLYDNSSTPYKYSISVYINTGSGLKKIDYQYLTSNTDVYVSVCYDGTVWYISDGILYIINNISSTMPQGNGSTRMTTTSNNYITYLSITPGSYYIGNVDPYYSFPYYNLTETELANPTSFQTPTFEYIVIPSDQMVWGISLNGSSYIYNNYTAKWIFESYNISNTYCISIGTPPTEYNLGQNTVCYSLGTNFYLGTINTIIIEDYTIFSNITWIQSIKSSISLKSIDMLNDTNIWSIGTDSNIYQFTGTIWNNIPFPTPSISNVSKNVSIGYDGTVMAIDTSNNIYVYNSTDSTWTQNINIYLSQISLGSKDYYWGVDNNNKIYNYYNNHPIIEVYPPSLPSPIFSVYVNVCYDGTVWALINNNLYRRDGITSGNPEGIVWILMTNSINDATSLISIGSGPNTTTNSDTTYIFPLKPPTQTMVVPYDTVIWGQNANSAFYFKSNLITQNYGCVPYFESTSTIPTDTVIFGIQYINYYKWNINNQNWDVTGNANCLSYGCDQYTIICYNTQIILLDVFGNSTSLQSTGLSTEFTKFISISMADQNNIWGIINNNNIYKYDNISETWLNKTEENIILNTISVGYDTSVFATSNNSFIYKYNKTTELWESSLNMASQISVASSIYYWGIYNNIITLYTTQISYTINNPITEIITSINISVSYNGTVWCICNGFIYNRIGISQLYQQGIDWVKVTQIINTPNISSIVSGAGSTYLIGTANIDYSWTFYGEGGGQTNCIGIGCDNTVIYCDNSQSYINTNNSGWIFHSIIPTLFTNISVADINNIWAVSQYGLIYKMENNHTWSLISGPITQSISEGFDGTVMITDMNDNIYILSDVSWIKINNINLSKISVGSKNYYWGIRNGSVYSIYNNKIIYVPPPPLSIISNADISVSYDGTVWVLFGGLIFTRTGITQNIPEGISWKQISNPISSTNPSLLKLSANSGPSNWNNVSTNYIYPFYPKNNIVIWSVLKSGEVYIFSNGKWSILLNNQNLLILQISIGIDGSVYAITNTTNNNLYFRDGITAYNLSGTNWVVVPNNLILSYICVYNINTVYGITTSINNIVYMSATNLMGFNMSLIKVEINDIYKIPISISLGSDGYLNIITSEGECYSIGNTFLQYTLTIKDNSIKNISQDGNNIWSLVDINGIIKIVYNYKIYINSPDKSTIITDFTVTVTGLLLVLCEKNNISYIYKLNGSPKGSYFWTIFDIPEINIIKFSAMSPIYPLVPNKIQKTNLSLLDNKFKASSDPGVNTAYYYKGTENYPINLLPQGYIQSPESLYFNSYSNSSFCFGICTSGGGSRASNSALGIYQSLFNESFYNFNYFTHTSSNSGGGYTNFKLNYKPYTTVGSNPSTDTNNPIALNLMYDYYYTSNQLTTSIINSNFIGPTSLGYGSTFITVLIDYWTWESKQLLPFGLYSNVYLTTPWFFTTFNKTSYDKYVLKNITQSKMIKIISRCDKDVSGMDNMPIPIAAWGCFYSNKNNYTNQQLYPNEFSGSSAGAYRTPGSVSTTGYNFKTDNIVYGSYNGYSAANGIISNPEFTKIDEGFTYTYSSNMQPLDGLYISSSAIGTVLQSAYGTIIPQLIGSYTAPTINPKTKPIPPSYLESLLGPSFPSYESNSLYSADGGEIDNNGLIVLLQRKLNHIYFNSIPGIEISLTEYSDISLYFGTPNIQTVIGSALELIPQFGGIYATNIDENFQLCVSVFPANELITMWNNLYNNYINYGVSITTFKHTFSPSTQAKSAYGFDDTFYLNYYPIITWNIIQGPGKKTYAIKYDTNLTLKQNAFWKCLNIQGSSSSSIWSTYKDVTNSLSFPDYFFPILTLSINNIKCLSCYTSSLSDYYIIPWFKNNAKPFNLFATNTNFFPTLYLNEELISLTLNFSYSITPSSIYGSYLPQQSKYIIGGYSISNSYFLQYLTQSGNSTNLSSNYWKTTSLSLNPFINLNISGITVNYDGIVCICGINNTNLTQPAIYYNYSSVTSTQVNYSFSTFVTTSTKNFNVKPCILQVSIHLNQNIPATNILYLGSGQSSNCINSNLWVSENSGKTFKSVNPTSIAVFNNTSYITSVFSIVQTCAQYRPKNITGYFQYAVATKKTNIDSSYTYYLTFCTIPYSTVIYTLYNPLISEINYETSIIYGIEYCPTINMLVVAYNIGNNIAIDLYNCNILSISSDLYTVPIRYKNILMKNQISCSNLSSYGLEYVGKQLLLWVNNSIYSLIDITYNSTSPYIPTSVTFTPFFTSNSNLINII